MRVEVDREILQRAAEQFGTPLFLYDLRVLRARVAKLRAAFGASARLLYAVKANPSIASMMRPLADGADVASLGELERVIAAGFSPRGIQLAGPAKSDRAIAGALASGAAVSVESAAEVRRIAAMFSKTGAEAPPPAISQVRLALRCAPNEPARAFGAPADRAFGLAREEIPAALQEIAAAGPALVLEGLHVHAGSQCFSATAFSRHVERTLDLAAEIEGQIGRVLRVVNFGGGFGIASNRELDVAALGKRVAPHAAARPATTFVFEPGRWIAGPAGVYLARVVDVRRGTAFLDGGMHHLVSATGLFGPHDHPIHNLSRPGDDLLSFDLAGPLCSQLDRVRGARIAPPRSGDSIAFFNAGSYGLSFSPSLFLSHPPPVEVAREGDDLWVL